MSFVGALTKALKAGETAKKTAPFYSAVDEALANIARPKGTGAEFLTELSKQPGVKKAELADRKLEQAFKAKGKMTKEEAQQVLKENPPPKLQEREYNEKMIRDEEDIKEELAQERYGMSYDDLTQRERNPIYNEAQRIMGEENGPQYGDYKFPGGENYREILLKLPAQRPNPREYRDPAKYDADMRAFNASGKKDYQSNHWKQDSNVLAHMRVQDRRGPNGEKILHVEEIQSDWHQEGRKQGYRSFKPPYTVEADPYGVYRIKDSNGETFTPYVDGERISGFMTAEAAENAAKANIQRFPEQTGVPDAPFKKNWHELAMKRLLNYAADNGYDSIALTPGAEQAKRFSLSKQIDALEWDERTGRLFAKQKNGNDFNKMADGVTSENLSDYVGKEVADKLMSQPSTGTNRMLGGVDLEVGGEGMKGFYDQILPSYLNTFGKPYGSQISTFSIPGDRAETVERLGVAGRNLSEMTPQEVIDFNKMVDEAGAIKLHSFPITPQMREQIKQKGLPLYQQIGIPTAGAGAASQVPQAEEEAGLSIGGMVNSAIKQAHLAKLAKMREEMTPRAEAVKSLIAKDENKYLRDVAPNSLTNAEIEAEIARMKAKAEASQPEVKKADGGAINYNTAPDMADGGRIMQGAPFKRGGKVKMTANRDTMFLELSNKKLKRK
jgi:hypothetical protein